VRRNLLSFSLLIIDPDGRAKQWPIRSGTLSLGRGKANDLIIVGRGVSRNHAILKAEDETVQIEDQDSTYGTKVNGRQVRSATLSVGDHVDIGVFRLILVPSSDLIEETGGRSRARLEDSLTEPSGEGIGHFDEMTTGVLTTDSEFTPLGLRRERDQSAHRFDPSLSAIGQVVRDSQLNVRFVRGGLTPAFQAVDLVTSGTDRPSNQMVARVEHLAQSLSDTAAAAGERRAESADLASLLLVHRAAELMSEVPNLSEYLDQVLDMLVRRLGISTAVLVRRTELGQLQAVSVRHQDPLKQGEIPVSRAVVDKALETGQPVFSSDLRTDPSFGHRDSVMAYQVGALLAVPLLLSFKAVGVLYLSRAAGSSFDRTETETVIGICALLAKAMSLREMESDAQQQLQRNKILERFHAPEVLERLFEPRDQLLGTQSLKATVLHVELDHFDGLLEELEGAALHETVVGFRSLVYEAVFGNGGTIVWLRNCSGMAFFGGQSTAESDAAWALAAAMEMVREFRSLSRQLGLPAKVAIRLGLDRGPLAVGILGPNDRLLYTALGMPVVRARWACLLGKPGGIHATEHTLAQIPNPRGRVEELQNLDPALGCQVFHITV
jgi:class 3 adenylate cyclase/pSer/pThr/pTyr-binding forkhead associated (FHA) protein/putative methionine-R-sulfoxide reductase with GAF domain